MFVKLKKPMIGYKKVKAKFSDGRSIVSIVKLEIPKGATVFFSFDDYYDKRYFPMTIRWNGRLVLIDGKMRADRARVVSVTRLNSSRLDGKFYTVPLHFNDTLGKSIDYKVGKMVKPHVFDRSERQCAGGIHFFTRRKEAMSY